MFKDMEKLNKDTLVTLEVVKKLKEFEFLGGCHLSTGFSNEGLSLDLYISENKLTFQLFIIRKGGLFIEIYSNRCMTLSSLSNCYYTTHGKHLEF